MGNFPGGSAWAMAKDIGDGVLLPTERTFVRLQPGEMEQLAFELDRALRDVRSDQPSLDDQAALLARNRRITRLNQGLTMLRAARARRRPAPPFTPGGAKGGPAGRA
jgi:hypothetical protein